MKSISVIIKSIRNLLPYLLLIGIYFFFVNLEARNDTRRNQNTLKEKLVTDDKSIIDKTLRISIPVVPYNQ